jgi:hypothetical protein
MRRIAIVAMAAVWAAVALSGVSRAAEPVALVLELDGAMEPPVEPFSELAPGETIRLSDGATLAFLHYPSCAEVTVRGGRLVLSEQRYTLQGGKIVSVDRARCPKTVVLTENRQVGGVLLRGGGGPSLSTRPEFVIAGQGAGDVARVRVRDGDTVLAEAAVAGKWFEWPEGAAELAAKKGYKAELLDASGAVLKTLEFEAKSKRGRKQVTVVRVR